MNIAIYGRKFSGDYFPHIQQMITALEKKVNCFFLYDKFYDFFCSGIKFTKEVKKFSHHNHLNKDTLCMLSIGGDGTLLDTLLLVRDSGIPVLGVNTGKLGFLSAVAANEISYASDCLITGNYTLDSRSIVQIKSPENLFGDFAYALNELTIMKRDTASMITISVSVNNQFLNTYWADGIIVSTPTGSTGYSLSCGGPIISPESKNLVITPIASHNLTVRPIVIPDSAVVKLKVEGKIQDYLLVMDSRSITLKDSKEIILSLAPYTFDLVCPGEKDFYQTIRNKLTWGLDKRN